MIMTSRVTPPSLMRRNMQLLPEPNEIAEVTGRKKQKQKHKHGSRGKCGKVAAAIAYTQPAVAGIVQEVIESAGTSSNVIYILANKIGAHTHTHTHAYTYWL